SVLVQCFLWFAPPAHGHRQLRLRYCSRPLPLCPSHIFDHRREPLENNQRSIPIWHRTNSFLVSPSADLHKMLSVEAVYDKSVRHPPATRPFIVEDHRKSKRAAIAGKSHQSVFIDSVPDGDWVVSKRDHICHALRGSNKFRVAKAVARDPK